MPSQSFKRPIALAIVLATGGACGGAARTAVAPCKIPSYVPARGVGSGQSELSVLRPYRNFYAIGDVSSAAHLYTVWYQGIEPTVVTLRVTEDANGTIRVEQTGGSWGGLGLPPKQKPPPPPAKLDRFSRAVEEATAPCGSSRAIAYRGEHRVLRVYEVIKHGNRNFGWFATAELHVDEELRQIEGLGNRQSGFGLLEIPATMRWVVFTPPPGINGQKLLLENPDQPLTTAILAAVRELDAGATAPALDSLMPADDTTLLPAGFEQAVRAEVTIYGRANDFNKQQGGVHYVKLAVREAVFEGSAVGSTTIHVGKHPFKITATLASPLHTPAREHTTADFSGTLTISIDGGSRYRFSRSYPARGSIDLEGDAVVAPTGFVLPGASPPSPEAELLHAEFPGDAQFESFDVHVGVSVFGDPRN